MWGKRAGAAGQLGYPLGFASGGQEDLGRCGARLCQPKVMRRGLLDPATVKMLRSEALQAKVVCDVRSHRAASAWYHRFLIAGAWCPSVAVGQNACSVVNHDKNTDANVMGVPLVVMIVVGCLMCFVLGKLVAKNLPLMLDKETQTEVVAETIEVDVSIELWSVHEGEEEELQEESDEETDLCESCGERLPFAGTYPECLLCYQEH